MSRTHRCNHRTKQAPAQPAPRSPARRGPQQSDDASERPVRGPRDKGVRIGHTPVGKGVFARKRYPAETVVGEILGDILAGAGYGSRYCMDIGDGCVMEPHAPFRYVNHSCRPNCEFDCFDLIPAGATESQRRVFLISLREIRPGEELTIAYNWSAETAIACRCGEPTCRGWIVDPDQLALIKARAGGEEWNREQDPRRGEQVAQETGRILDEHGATAGQG